MKKRSYRQVMVSVPISCYRQKTLAFIYRTHIVGNSLGRCDELAKKKGL